MKKTIITILACLITGITFAVGITNTLSPDEFEQHGFSVMFQTNSPEEGVITVCVSAPLNHKGNITLSQIGFCVAENGATLVSSNVPFQELSKGFATGKFVVQAKLIQDTTIQIIYGPGSDVTYSLEIGKKEPASKIPETTMKKEERKENDRKDQTVFIKTARTALEKMNVPVAGRRSSVEYSGEEIIVKFHPKEGDRAGSFIVRIDRKTGEIRDTKIWR